MEESIRSGDLKQDNISITSNSNGCPGKIKVEIEINPFMGSKNLETHGMTKDI